MSKFDEQMERLGLIPLALSSRNKVKSAKAYSAEPPNIAPALESTPQAKIFSPRILDNIKAQPADQPPDLQAHVDKLVVEPLPTDNALKMQLQIGDPSDRVKINTLSGKASSSRSPQYGPIMEIVPPDDWKWDAPETCTTEHPTYSEIQRLTSVSASLSVAGESHAKVPSDTLSSSPLMSEYNQAGSSKNPQQPKVNDAGEKSAQGSSVLLENVLNQPGVIDFDALPIMRNKPKSPSASHSGNRSPQKPSTDSEGASLKSINIETGMHTCRPSRGMSDTDLICWAVSDLCIPCVTKSL